MKLTRRQLRNLILEIAPIKHKSLSTFPDNLLNNLENSLKNTMETKSDYDKEDYVITMTNQTIIDDGISFYVYADFAERISGEKIIFSSVRKALIDNATKELGKYLASGFCFVITNKKPEEQENSKSNSNNRFQASKGWYKYKIAIKPCQSSS